MVIVIRRIFRATALSTLMIINWGCNSTTKDTSCQDTECEPEVSVSDPSSPTGDSFNIEFSEGLEIVFIRLPSATFTMGSPVDEEGRREHETVHEVTLTNDIFMATTEITQGVFEQVMEYSAHLDLPTENSNGSFGVGAAFPAHSVSWYMAAKFANQLTGIHNQTHNSSLIECYSCSGEGVTVFCEESVGPYECSGYRIPTEAEFEYASRAGSTKAIWTPNGGGNLPANYQTASCQTTLLLTDGSQLSELIWYCANNTEQYGSKEVATKLANDFGLYDMSGNLWEWCHEFFGPYEEGSVINPEATSEAGVRKVVRGGGWYHTPNTLRTADRNDYPPDNRVNFTGFRLVIKAGN
jgi:formylglycine-generating enzyme